MQYYNQASSKIKKYLEKYQSLILLIGLAGCGKTTLVMDLIKKSRQKTTRITKTTRVCLDSIITMESGYNYDLELRNFYRELELVMVKKSLDNGYNLIVDDTNITKEIRKTFIELGKQYQNIQTIGIYFNIPIEICIKRRLDDSLLRLREEYSKKAYWSDIIKKQSNMMEKPSLTEGFDILFELDENSRVKVYKNST